MKKLSLTIIAALLSIGMQAQDSDNTERLWYDKPATIWLEALPIGNGRLGGMVYGGTQTEEIQLNEDSFWSGGPHNNNSTTAKANLEQVRSLIFNGKEQEERWKNIASQVSTAMSASLTRQADGGETLTEQARIAARDETDYRAFLRRFAAPREILKSDDDAFDPIYYTYGLQTFGNMPLIEPPETREERRIEDLVIAIDTSMSTTGETVRAFLSTTYWSDTVITDAFQLKTYMDHVTLSGGSATDFRPVFAHVEELRKQGALPALRGLLYFTDGMGIYPTHRTDYETAFILPEEPPLAYHVPPWAIRIVLDMAETDRATPEDWEDELKDEMPEL